ncbi:MAG: DNA polymerase I [Acidiferrobacterales bacterium]|nr:DNA polymerase I [Acidiferrobacterales bacterium]
MSPDKEIILIDGSSFLFRAYHALGSQGGLSTRDGQPTHAVFGVANMLRSLIKECQPQHIAMVMDAKGKTFRHEMYAEYKANRPPMPDDLRVQLAYLLKLIPAMGLPLVSIEGVEADDVIGTLSEQAVENGFHVMIVSSDKDLAQLVNEKVVMVDTMKKSRLDEAGVLEKFGVPPSQIIEYLALMGDSSDNIPGVPKVGPKTAVKWLTQFGSLDELVSRADEIGGKVGESLRENLELLALSRTLATVKCDVDTGLEFDDLQMGDPNVDKLRELYTELEFRNWLKELDKPADTPSTSGSTDPAEGSANDNTGSGNKSQSYETLLDEVALDRWIKRLESADIFALDTETTSLDAHQARLVGLSFSDKEGEAAYLPVAHDYEDAPTQISLETALNKLRPLLEDPSSSKTGQNLKYDLEVLHHHGVQLAGVDHDTMLMSYLLDAGNTRHDMDTLAMKHLGVTTTKFSDVAGTGKKQLTFNQVPLDVAANYAAEDADITLRLHHALLPELQKQERLYALYTNVEIPLLHTLARTETNGVRVDPNMLHQQSAEIADRLSEIERKAHMSAGEEFNIASPKQIQEILFEKQGLPVISKTPKGQPSTAESVLQELALDHELPKLIVEHRGLAKLKSTYTDKLPLLINPETQRIHTSYHQAVAATGRLSSSDPNLQNIPIRTEEGRRIREAFVADEGNVLLAADYSQIELRIMAHLSEDEGLVSAFQKGIDVHSATAAEVFGGSPEAVDAEQRRRAKAINFGLIYGMSAFGLAKQLQIPQRDAKEYIEIYFDRYPGVKRYMDETREIAREQGYVETLFGRRLNLPEIRSKNAARRQYAERTAINAPMQGTAADLIKKAMNQLDQWLTEEQNPARIILQVHDELVLEVASDAAEDMASQTAEIMCSVAELRVPLLVDSGIGDNWKQAH